MAADNNNNNEGLSTDELLAAGDPMSCKDIFWDALVANNEELAVRAGQTISVPNVVQQTFNFDEDEEGETLQVDDEGTLVAPIEPNSPSVVENAWNSSKPTSLTMVDYEAMCLCTSPTVGRGQIPRPRPFFFNFNLSFVSLPTLH